MEQAPSKSLQSLTLHAETDPFPLRLEFLRVAPHTAFNWHSFLEPGQIHFALNHSGEGIVLAPNTRLTLLPQTLSIFEIPEGKAPLTATRISSATEHEFLILTLSSQSLPRIFPSPEKAIRKNLGVIRRWTQRDIQLFNDLISPPVSDIACRAWYQAKILELLSLHLFHTPSPEKPLFCTQFKERTHRHVRLALELLHSRLSEPLDLRDLAEDVGCAPHYLSRLVKQDTGKTLSLHLRAFRIEKAAELLASGELNVTEVALSIGYNSLSHFTKAFKNEKEISPSDFLRRSQ